MSMSDEEAQAQSPRNRLKLLCSYGGKILPRPSDGQLKYVGGETRVLSVPRTIPFQELKKRIEGMFAAEVVVKYQLLPADLDALVSVTCEEDLRHMRDEYDRHDPRSPTATPRFRLFLFPRRRPPSRPRSPDHHHHRHYVDAINGAPPTPSAAAAGTSIFTLSSANTSPTSTVDAAAANSIAAAAVAAAAAAAAGGGGRGKGGLHRVHSTPNLGGSGNQFGGGGYSHGHHHQQQLPSPMAAYAPCRMGGVVMCMCGCGCRVTGPPPPVMMRGGFYYLPAGKGSGGGCVCSGHVDEPVGLPPRSAPHGGAFSAAASPRRSVVWE